MLTAPFENATCVFNIEPEYQVLKDNIGIGSFGVVCKARHVASDFICAIKKMPKVFSNMRNDEMRRLMREVQLLRSLNHPHVRKIAHNFNLI